MRKCRQQHWICVAAVLAAPALLGLPAAAETGFQIDTDASCTSSSCHDRLTAKKQVHTPAAAGDECAMCHEPAVEGKHGFALAAEGSELCFTCHDEEEFAGKTTHGPVGEGKCVACHNPHASDHDSMLRAEAPGLCFGCHDRTLKDAGGKPLPSPMRTFEDKAKKLHPPFEEGACLSCHLPHASENYRLLTDPYPASLYARFSSEAYFCFNCHDDEAFTEPRTMSSTGFRNGNLNLHYRHVNRKKGRSCKACHDHHGADREKLIRDQVSFGKRSIVISAFSRNETGGSCAPMCHIAVSYDRLDPAINKLKVTPRRGTDATPAQLKRAAEEQSEE